MLMPSLLLQGSRPHHTVMPITSSKLGHPCRLLCAGVQPGWLSPTAAQQRTAVRAVTAGQLRETASNGNGSRAQHGGLQDSMTAEQAAEAPKQQFNWHKAWYPVAVLKDLDKQLPMHAQLLGMDLAIWWDSNTSQWRAFQDRCPHRLAPLSEGIIDASTGHLYCSYHGWTFDGQGSCTSVPQLPEGQSLSRTRSCAVSYPTRTAEGLLWVWPDASPAALVESADEAAWPGLAPEIDQLGDAAWSRSSFTHGWYARDLPYPYLAAKENAYNDCSHDQVLHHGVSAFADRARAKPIPMRLTQMTPVGYTVSEASGAFSDTTRFPCGARRDYAGAAGVAYVVPTGVSSCRQFHAFLQKAPAAVPPPPPTSTAAGSSAQAASPSRVNPLAAWVAGLQVWLRGNKPTWMQHMFSHVLIDADLAIQSRVDLNRSVSDHVYMPAAADAGPAAFMRWLKEYGGGGPPVTKLKDPFVGHAPTVPRDRRQLLDRFNQHTKHCKACRTAHQQASAAHRLAGVLALIAGSAALVMATLAAAGAVLLPPGAAAVASAGGLSAAQVAAGSSWGLAGGLAVLAAVLGGAYVALGKLVEKFVFVDYDIAHVGKRPAH